MQLIINAWLERPAPYLQIVDCETGISVAHFEGAELQRLHTQGIIAPEDLISRDAASQKTLLQELLIAACCDQIRSKRECNACSLTHVCPHHPHQYRFLLR